MKKVLFASCMNGLKNDNQRVWNDAIAHEPDWLILCGDNIYMDWWPNGKQSQRWSLQKFSEEMEARYRKQFSVASFRSIVESIDKDQVIGVWDDHDFAWNNCHGADPSHDMNDKKKIATAYHHHYFSELNKRPLAHEFPALTIPDLKNPPDGTKPIYRSIDGPGMRVLLCDVRSWRSEHPTDERKSDLLGTAQETWLFNELNSHPGPFMVVSGSTMTNSDDAWENFGEFFNQRFLPAVQDKLVLFVAGDVHENRLPPRNGRDPIEIVSSASGLSFPYKKRGRFGLIEIDENTASVYLFKRGRDQYTGQIDLGTGFFATTMSEFQDESDPLITAEEATELRAEAMGKLLKMQQR